MPLNERHADDPSASVVVSREVGRSFADIES
jgi:hypothetical protein